MNEITMIVFFPIVLIMLVISIVGLLNGIKNQNRGVVVSTAIILAVSAAVMLAMLFWPANWSYFN